MGSLYSCMARHLQRFKSVDAEFVQLMRRVAHKPSVMEVSTCLAGSPLVLQTVLGFLLATWYPV